MSSSYKGASAALATMHGKESVIAPVMQKYLGLSVVTPAHIDTDALGTFTGETPRVGSMRDVAIRKARLGMRASGLSIGMASEGSFGPHPAIPFLRAGVELMVMVDDERGVVISESLITEETNYDEIVAASMSDLEPFLIRTGFPAHALVVGPNQTASPWWRLHPEFSRINKGIASHDGLAVAVGHAARISEDGRARVLTDMRAHMNPIRMQAIASLADKLAHRIATECPECSAPGFGPLAAAAALSCASCGEESIIPRGDVWGCFGCGHKREEARHPLREMAEPGDCPRCNP